VPQPGRLNITIVAANPFEFDSRFLRSATSLAADGHRLRILGWSAPGLPPEEELAPGVQLTRLDIDRRISNALKPLPRPLRAGICRILRLDFDSQVLPPDSPRGFDRVLHLGRRTLEMVANARRAGPWAEAVVLAAPDTDVFHAQSLIVLPVVRDAAGRVGGRFVYDVADYHTEAARLARMPWIVREVVRRRERDWARDGSAFLAVSDPVADLVVRRWGVPRPTVLWNCPPAWRPDQPGIVESNRIREATGIEPERPVVLYQGGFSVDRGVEELVAAATKPRLMELGAAIVFMGYGRLETFIADAVAAHPGRIYLLPPVRPDDLMPWTASADVSFVGQPPRTLNQRMNLPNKLFESIMAGVPVVVSLGNEQCRLTSGEHIGMCVDIDDPEDIAAGCADLLAAPVQERRSLRTHCREVALEKYTWDRTAVGLIELYRKLAREGAPAQSGASIRDGASPRGAEDA
jgi:glycosyltransferase involved in cell wall biosynthesis